MISFYPGPSRVYDEIPKYVKQAHKEGVLSINHRSEEFVTIIQNTVGLLQSKLDVPEDYTIFFTSSATECWEIIAQSFISKRSYHLFNGAFGEKWFDYTRKINSGSRDYKFDREEQLHPPKYKFGSGEGLICITQNETSNGTQVSNEIIQQIKDNNPSHLVAVDATSSMAGIKLNFTSADIWFASVQKCFGLPAGLALMLCSPGAIKRMKDVGENEHYNSGLFMLEMMKKWQTTCTPNVLGIYLLMRVLEQVKHIDLIDLKLKRRYDKWIAFFDNHPSLKHLIKNRDVHSYTVLPIRSDANNIASLKTAAKEKDILLGEGYGDLKKDTFRIANFPALKKPEIRLLRNFLKKQ